MPHKSIDLKHYIRAVADWPKKGILFRDITPLLADGKALMAAVDALCDGFAAAGVEYVAAVEARGFIFGAMVAARFGAGFVPIRKMGKLPHVTESMTYDLEYGTDTVEVHKDAFKRGASVLMVDDLLATGGTMLAACRLIEKIGGRVAGVTCLIELTRLDGRRKLAGYDVRAVIRY